MTGWSAAKAWAYCGCGAVRGAVGMSQYLASEHPKDADSVDVGAITGAVLDGANERLLEHAVIDYN